jgi:hypothetical protein
VTFLAAALPWIGIALQGAGLVFDVVGQQKEAQSAAQLADYRAEVARRNAKLLMENSTRTVHKGQVDHYAQDLASRAVMGDQIAAQGASGLSLGSGSFVRSRAATRQLARLNALNVRQAAELEAFNYRQQAEDFTKEADFLKKTRNNTIIQGAFTSMGTVVKGLSQMDFRSLTNNTSTGMSVPVSGGGAFAGGVT